MLTGRRIHKRVRDWARFATPLAKEAAIIACTIYTIDKRFASWAWKDVTCLPCLRKRPSG